MTLSQTSFEFNNIRQGTSLSGRYTITNTGGGTLTGTIKANRPWVALPQGAIDQAHHIQEHTFHLDTSKMTLGTRNHATIEIASNAGTVRIDVSVAVEMERAALSRWRKQLFWAGILLGLILGLAIYNSMPPPYANAVTRAAGLVGAIALVVVCAVAGKWGGGIGGFFLAYLVQTVFERTTMPGYSGVAWAEIASAFLFFWAKPLLTARLAGNARAKIGAAVSGIVVGSIIVGAGVAVERSIPQPLNFGSKTLPVEDKLTGSTIGAATGVRWTNAIGERGAVFSAANSSRIEYPGLIPPEGTLEFWIKVDGGYGYNNFQLRTNQDAAMIFSSDAQGGDVIWPGTTKFFVSRAGSLTYWMATNKYDKPHALPTEARKTRFRFGEWHAIGVSYGRQGEYIMLDGKVVASSPGRTQTFGQAGNHQEPLDIPTIGETVSHFWPHHRLEGGFEGVLAAFRVSAKPKDWLLAEGIKDKGSPNGGGSSGEPQKAERGDPTHACALFDNQDYSGQITVPAAPWTQLNRGQERDGYSLSTAGSLSYLGQMLTNNIPVTGGSDNHWNYAQSIALSSKSPSGRFAILQACEEPNLGGLCWALFVVDFGSQHIEKTLAGKYGPERSLAFIRGLDEYAVLHYTNEGVTTYYRIHLPTGQSVECGGKTNPTSFVGFTENHATPAATLTRQPEKGTISVSSRLDPSERLLRRDELEGLSKRDLQILRNLPYARHGYSFRQREMKDYFSEQPWYRATVPAAQFVPSVLTAVEQQNITLISQFQKDRGLE
jgi:hypothetical protein